VDVVFEGAEALLHRDVQAPELDVHTDAILVRRRARGIQQHEFIQADGEGRERAPELRVALISEVDAERGIGKERQAIFRSATRGVHAMLTEQLPTSEKRVGEGREEVVVHDPAVAEVEAIEAALLHAQARRIVRIAPQLAML